MNEKLRAALVELRNTTPITVQRKFIDKVLAETDMGVRSNTPDVVRPAPANEPPADVVERLDRLAAHLESMDSGSGDAKLLRESIQAMTVTPKQVDDIDAIFLKAFRGDTKGSMQPDVRKRIKRGLNAISCYLTAPKAEGWRLGTDRTMKMYHGIGCSYPLVFKTIIPDVGTHYRLGYYDLRLNSFIESGKADQMYNGRVESWFQLPPEASHE